MEEDTENCPSGKFFAEGRSISPGMPYIFREAVSSNSFAFRDFANSKLKAKKIKPETARHLRNDIEFTYNLD
tara:strand:- start:12 stop:227 length:216 start_codon:yes stop_codon:yes gene_type:complete